MDGAANEIPDGEPLIELAEAVVRQDAGKAGALRVRLRDTLGVAGLVDACATIASFHGFTRVADATGIEVEEMRADAAELVQQELGLGNPPSSSMEG